MGRATRRIGPGGLHALIAVALAGGCTRPPLDTICPPVEAGDLVVSEVRGDQTDPWGQWIELYNRRSGPVSLAALTVKLLRLDGMPYGIFAVRDNTLQVAPGGYVVLGNFAPAEKPGHVDYGWRPATTKDFTISTGDPGVIELWSCQVQIDIAIYHHHDRIVGGNSKKVEGLPPGTLALDGARDPDAADNNGDEGRWCTDGRPAGADGGTPIPDGGAVFGLPGTPGARNISCH